MVFQIPILARFLKELAHFRIRWNKIGIQVCLCFSVCLIMAAILTTPAYLKPTQSNIKSLETHKRLICCCLSLKQTNLHLSSSNKYNSSIRFPKFVSWAAASEEVTDIITNVEESQTQKILENEILVEESTQTSNSQIPDTEKKLLSAVSESLRLYKEALASNDEPKIVEIEACLQSLYDEKKVLENKVAALSIEVALEKDRRLRINADFFNFRKRVERERLSLVTNMREEVVETLLPVLDNFERVNSEIKVETDAEKKINNSYQSIFKQYLEILGSLGVVPVDTAGNPYKPMAKYRVDSKLNRLLEDFFRALGRVRSGFMKTWIQL
ncbi:hypothetical protein MKX01_003684 [Papaver californicum]|nr:hypothetical protein MKX01_003684 [Papaver californicum]